MCRRLISWPTTSMGNRLTIIPCGRRGPVREGCSARQRCARLSALGSHLDEEQRLQQEVEQHVGNDFTDAGEGVRLSARNFKCEICNVLHGREGEGRTAHQQTALLSCARPYKQPQPLFRTGFQILQSWKFAPHLHRGAKVFKHAACATSGLDVLSFIWTQNATPCRHQEGPQGVPPISS